MGSPGLAMKCVELKCLPFFFSIFKYVGFIFTLRYSCFKMMTYTTYTSICVLTVKTEREKLASASSLVRSRLLDQCT